MRASGVAFRKDEVMRQLCLRAARQSILDKMLPAVRKAKQYGYNFYLEVENKTFTPHELALEWAQGRYLWGPQWWRLVNPVDGSLTSC